MMMKILVLLPFSIGLLFFLFAGVIFPQTSTSKTDEKAEAILAKAVQNMGGDKYLKATSQYGRGKFSVIQNNAIVSFQSFADVIVFPDKERTEFRNAGVKTVQTNVGNGGWVLDGDKNLIRDQDAAQIKNFKDGVRTSLDNLLRGQWRKEATLTYAGKRAATLGKRNDVLQLTYNDQSAVIEFEFSDDGLPVKALYHRLNVNGEDIKEEDRYAQFVDVDGVKTPFIIDRFSNGTQTSRINYESIEFNRSVPDSVFAKPSNPKDLKKDLRL